jgi:probable HAF family extracellular repeat protein
MNQLARTVVSLMVAVLCTCSFSPHARADTATFYNVGVGSASSLSRNGQYRLVTRTGGDLYRWSAATGQVSLGLNLGTNGFATNVSDDGNVIIGYRRNASNQTIGFRWTAASGFTDLGDLPGGSTYSIPYAMSADGNAITGLSSSTASGTNAEAFRWTAGTGIQGLGDFPGGSFYSNSIAISADGSTIVGTGNQAAGYEAYRWTEATGMVGLGDLPGGYFNSQAYAVSSDGTAIAGYSYDELNREQAFRWTQDTGLVPLGFASTNPNEWSQGRGISGAGNIIIGNNNTGATLPDVKALIWDSAHGMRYLKTALLTDYALDTGLWKITEGYDISDDGRTLSGSGYNPSGVREAWVVSIVPEPTATALIGAAAALFMRRRR